MKALLSRDKLVPFLTEISQKMEVVAPVLINGERVFCTWTGQPLALDENPLNPPSGVPSAPRVRPFSDMSKRAVDTPSRRSGLLQDWSLASGRAISEQPWSSTEYSERAPVTIIT